MTRHAVAAEVRAVDWPDFPPDRHPETLEWIARIEAVRRNIELPNTRRCCGPCSLEKPLTEFARNPGETGGRAYTCKACKATEARQRRRSQKITAFRAILGRAS